MASALMALDEQMNREAMQPIQINIPSASLPPTPADYADFIIASMKECGLDPQRCLGNKVAIQAASEWAHGRLTIRDFKQCLRNLAVMNPGLRGTNGTDELPENS